MIELDYAIYDAFATEAFGGSPAALVAGAEVLTAEQMQRTAGNLHPPLAPTKQQPLAPPTGH